MYSMNPIREWLERSIQRWRSYEPDYKCVCQNGQMDPLSANLLAVAEPLIGRVSAVLSELVSQLITSLRARRWQQCCGRVVGFLLHKGLGSWVRFPRGSGPLRTMACIRWRHLIPRSLDITTASEIKGSFDLISQKFARSSYPMAAHSSVFLSIVVVQM